MIPRFCTGRSGFKITTIACDSAISGCETLPGRAAPSTDYVKGPDIITLTHDALEAYTVATRPGQNPRINGSSSNKRMATWC